MFQGYRTCAILLMGGTGSRFEQTIPKQFALLRGKPLYRYALETLLSTDFFDEILLVCHADWINRIPQEPVVRVIAGGPTRQESSYAGLKALSPTPHFVLIHDAVRPLITQSIVQKNLEAAIQWGACDTCIPSADTLVFAPGGTQISSIPKREEFLRGQTPQTFRTEWILEAHTLAAKEGRRDVTDDCRLVLDAGYPVAVVAGSEKNFKITHDLDLVLAEAVLKKLHNLTEASIH